MDKIAYLAIMVKLGVIAMIIHVNYVQVVLKSKKKKIR